MIKLERVCISTKDIMIITGKSERYARNLLQKIRVKLDKKPNQFVTIKEFCEYTGLNEEEINKIIQG